jgi:Tfp pilus assembly protein PilO
MGANKKIIIISLIVATILLLLIIFGFFPIIKNIVENSDKLLQEREDLAQIEKRVKNSEQIKSIYAEIEPSMDKISVFFIDPQMPVDLIKFWEKTANNCGVSINISNITPQTPAEGEQKKGAWMPVSFQMTLDGSFAGFSRFLDKIENSPYLVEVQSVTIKKLSSWEIKDGEQSSVSAILTLNAFSKQ